MAHYGGAPCDLTVLREIVQSNNIVLIADAVYTAGTQYQN